MRLLQKKPDVFKGLSKNFMTPHVLGYYKLKKGYAELSEGTGIIHQPIYGVTVRPGGSELSRLFYSLVAATDYIEALSQEEMAD